MTIQFHNKKILVTRNEPKASEFAEMITSYGGRPIVVPLLKIDCKAIVEHDLSLERIKEYEWLVFTSANGVRCFFNSLERRRIFSDLEHVKMAVVGPKTDSALGKFGFKADFIPSVYHADTMAREFPDLHTPTGPVLLIHGQLSGTILNEAFLKQKIPFDCVEIYETRPNTSAKSELKQVLMKEEMDFITFTSPSTIETFMDLKDKLTIPLDTMIVCIGTTTEKRARDYGFYNILVPKEFTINGMMDKIHEYISEERMEGRHDK